MKLVDVTGKLTNGELRTNIKNETGLIEDIVGPLREDEISDYSKYRILKATRRIRMYLNEIKNTKE